LLLPYLACRKGGLQLSFLGFHRYAILCRPQFKATYGFHCVASIRAPESGLAKFSAREKSPVHFSKIQNKKKKFSSMSTDSETRRNASFRLRLRLGLGFGGIRGLRDTQKRILSLTLTLRIRFWRDSGTQRHAETHPFASLTQRNTKTRRFIVTETM
jgi:hypothetical protein